MVCKMVALGFIVAGCRLSHDVGYCKLLMLCNDVGELKVKSICLCQVEVQMVMVVWDVHVLTCNMALSWKS